LGIVVKCVNTEYLWGIHMAKQELTIKATDGSLFIATKDVGSLWDQPWEVDYPEGGFKFYGTTSGVRTEILKTMKELGYDPE
jgi:hypothetical protein